MGFVPLPPIARCGCAMDGAQFSIEALEFLRVHLNGDVYGGCVSGSCDRLEIGGDAGGCCRSEADSAVDGRGGRRCLRG